MYYLLYVALDRFYAGECERPVVVHRAGMVVDSSPAARARRVQPGTLLSEAKAILRSDAQYVELREADYRERRDRWLQECLLYSGRIQHESPASAWVDLGAHPRPWEVAARLLADVWRKTALPVASALAPSRWVAKLAAQPCDATAMEVGIADFPLVEDARSFLSPLPTRCLTPVAPDVRERLEFLGYRKVGDVQRAPLPLLIRQFGKEGVLVTECAHGRYRDAFVRNFPCDSVERTQRFHGCCSDLFVLQAAMDEIAQELCQELRERDALAGATEVVIETESGRVLRRVRRLPKPSDSLAVSLRWQLSQVRLTEPVASLRVGVPDVRSVPVLQRSLDSSRADALRSALCSVRAVRAMYGDAAVQRASEVDLPRREQVMRAWRNATGWR